MEVILLEALEGVGARGAIVNVKPGFARNYLLPRRLAIPAGTKAANLYKELERQKKLQDEKLLVGAREEAARIDGLQLDISAQANEEDTLFGSITSTDIAEALDIPEGTARSRLRRGRELLAAKMAELLGSPPAGADLDDTASLIA